MKTYTLALWLANLYELNSLDAFEEDALSAKVNYQ